MTFRQLFDSDLSTYPNLLADTHSRQAIIVAPVRAHARRDLGLLKEVIEIMNHLDVPMPGKIGEAVSANLRGGKTDG